MPETEISIMEKERKEEVNCMNSQVIYEVKGKHAEQYYNSISYMRLFTRQAL